MKSLIIKDLYNIKSYSRQLVISLIFMGVCFLPSTGGEGFVVASAVVCSMMTITSFSFDERSKWEKYALIMPISRKEYVMSKYVLNILLGVIGVVFGLFMGSIAGILMGSFDMVSMLIGSGIGLAITIVEGSITIPIILRYGSENARIVMIAAVTVPTGLIFLVFKAVQNFHIQITNNLIYGGSAAAGALIVVTAIFSYMLGKKWFYKKEF